MPLKITNLLLAIIAPIFFIVTACSSNEIKIDDDLIMEEFGEILTLCPSTLPGHKIVELNDQTNFCTINKVACFTECKTGDANACFGLARVFEDIEAGYNQTAPALYAHACKNGLVLGCTNRAAGIVNLEPDYPEKDRCGFDTFTYTCENEDAWGCMMLGFVTMYDDRQFYDPELAINSFEKTCALDSTGDPCNMLEPYKKELEEKLSQDQQWAKLPTKKQYDDQ